MVVVVRVVVAWEEMCVLWTLLIVGGVSTRISGSKTEEVIRIELWLFSANKKKKMFGEKDV